MIASRIVVKTLGVTVVDRAEIMKLAVAAADRIAAALEAGAWLGDGSPSGRFLDELVALTPGDDGPQLRIVLDASRARVEHVRANLNRGGDDHPPAPGETVEERAAWAGLIYDLVEPLGETDTVRTLLAGAPSELVATSEGLTTDVTRLALWSQGHRSEHQPQEAEHWFRLAVDAGYLPARNDLARMLDEQGRTRAARVLWTTAAGDGDADAAANLGGFYDRQGDRTEADAWWRRATEMGHVDAGVRLGQQLYDRGEQAEAETLWRWAATEGHGDACELLGTLLAARGEVPEARQWLEQAAIDGHAGACRQLAGLYERTGRHDEAIEWLRAAAELGHPDAAELLEALETEPSPAGRSDAASRLSGRRPDQDRIDELQDRVNAHDHIARQAMESGRWDDAYHHNNEAIATVRGLQRIDPHNSQNERVLAAKLYNQATIASSLGRVPEGIDAADEAVALYRDAAEADPLFRPELADAQARLGRLVAVMGASPLVDALFDDAVRTYREVVANDPDRVRDLARILSLRADATWYSRPLVAAETAAESLRIYRPLAASLAAADQRHFAVAALLVAKDQLARGHRRDALATARDSVELFRRYAARSPGDVAALLSQSLAVEACCHEALGDLDAARTALAAAAEELDRHPAAAEGRPAAEELLADLHRRLG